MSYDIVVWSADGSRRQWAFSDDAILVGRDPQCGIRLNDLSLSRRHAKLIRTGAGFFITDLGSTNGTYVNGRRIRGVHPVLGAAVRIGRCRLSLVPQGAKKLSDTVYDPAITAMMQAVQQLPDVLPETEMLEPRRRPALRVVSSTTGTVRERQQRWRRGVD